MNLKSGMIFEFSMKKYALRSYPSIVKEKRLLHTNNFFFFFLLEHLPWKKAQMKIFREEVSNVEYIHETLRST